MRPATESRLVVGGFVLLACAGAPLRPVPTSAPHDLPERIYLKTPERAFTHEWYVAVHGGQLWVKPNGGDAPWALLPPDGRAHHVLTSDGPPPRIREISADGDNLVVVASDGLVHYMKFSDFGWIDEWGLPFFSDPLYAPAAHRGLVISHRGFLAAYYEDIDGKRHEVTHGVTTYYLLSPDGRRLSYADPWLPAHFNRRICLPERNRFIAAALSASASTLFVINEAGEMYTRLADYDTLGENPVLGYTFERGPGDTDRTLPAEEWTRQPPIPAPVTSRITIVQTGAGNAERELRVEGWDREGKSGYWAKRLLDTAWSFVPTGEPASAPLLEAVDAAALRAPQAVDLAGRIVEPALPAVGVTLAAFDPDCSPLLLRLESRGERLEIPAHLHHPSRDADGDIVEAELQLLIPDAAAPWRPILDALFGEWRSIEAEVEIRDGEVSLTSDAPSFWSDLEIRFTRPN